MATYSLNKIKMSKSIQLKNKDNEKMYPHPYFPVGSIYLSVVNTNPTKWFGGTWELISQGRTLVGVDTNDADFNTVKKTGGAKTHTLSIAEMPSHNHPRGANNDGLWGTGGDRFTINNPNTGYSIVWDSTFTGGGQAHNNLQPYFTCYIWCRTA